MYLELIEDKYVANKASVGDWSNMLIVFWRLPRRLRHKRLRYLWSRPDFSYKTSVPRTRLSPQEQNTSKQIRVCILTCQARRPANRSLAELLIERRLKIIVMPVYAFKSLWGNFTPVHGSACAWRPRQGLFLGMELHMIGSAKNSSALFNPHEVCSLV